VRVLCLEPLGLAVPEAAKRLLVPVADLRDVCDGKAGISADLAIRLEKAFGGTADVWMRMQASYDLGQARRRVGELPIKRL